MWQYDFPLPGAPNTRRGRRRAAQSSWRSGPGANPSRRRGQGGAIGSSSLDLSAASSKRTHRFTNRYSCSASRPRSTPHSTIPGTHAVVRGTRKPAASDSGAGGLRGSVGVVPGTASGRTSSRRTVPPAAGGGGRAPLEPGAPGGGGGTNDSPRRRRLASSVYPFVTSATATVAAPPINDAAAAAAADAAILVVGPIAARM